MSETGLGGNAYMFDLLQWPEWEAANVNQALFRQTTDIGAAVVVTKFHRDHQSSDVLDNLNIFDANHNRELYGANWNRSRSDFIFDFCAEPFTTQEIHKAIANGATGLNDVAVDRNEAVEVIRITMTLQEYLGIRDELKQIQLGTLRRKVLAERARTRVEGSAQSRSRRRAGKGKKKGKKQTRQHIVEEQGSGHAPDTKDIEPAVLEALNDECPVCINATPRSSSDVGGDFMVDAIVICGNGHAACKGCATRWFESSRRMNPNVPCPLCRDGMFRL